MSGFFPSLEEKNPVNIIRAIRDLFQGRSNAFGTFTIAINVATTTVTAHNVGPGSCISLMPVTASAATAIGAGTAYILAANVTKGQFVVTHANSATADRTFRYAIQG